LDFCRRVDYKKLSQIFANLPPMRNEDNNRLRETVLAELQRRRRAAREEADRFAEQQKDNADEPSKPDRNERRGAF
jgi:hypothetical protein